MEAEALYIYLRDEYPGLHRVLREAIAELEAAGLVTPGYIVLRRGAADPASRRGQGARPRFRPGSTADSLP